jgi:caspase domain-containing protein
MRARSTRERSGLRIGVLIAALAMGVFNSSLADAQTNTRGPKVKLKENDGRESETYLYKESWALVIGVSNYEHWTDLPGVEKDVERVRSVLEKHGFKIQYLLNPTRQEFKSTIDEFINVRGLDFENRLVIYFAGHGVTLRGPDNREEGYLVMRDTPLSEPDETSFIQKAAPIGWMERYAKDIKSKHALFVFDSCFSGKLFEEMRRRGDPSTADLIKPVRQFITAGTANQRVPDKSIFCDYFVRAVDGDADSNNDGLVTGTELGEYLKRRVMEDSRRSQTPQTPMTGKIADPKLNQGDFVFALPGRVSKVLEATPSRDNPDAADARGELRDRGIGTDVTSVKNALMAVDVDVLKLLSGASVSPSVIEEAFRQKAGADNASVARRFFENSKRSPDAIKWFDSALASGVNPNLTVLSDYYEREGVLLEALRAANVPAIKALLERGASPHAYQNLFLTRYPLTRFLYPLRYIADDDRLSLEEKQDLIRAFIKAGVVVPKVIDPGSSGWPSVMYEAKNLRDEDARKLSMNLPPSRPFCEQQDNTICKQAGDDWCSTIAKIPSKLAFDFAKGGSSSPVYDVTLLHLLNIEGNKAYFLGLTRHITYDYVLVEVSKDASSWTVLRYMPPEAGMGLCKKDSDGYQSDYCWRRIPIRRVAGTDEMRFEDWGLSWRLGREDCSSLYPKDTVKK